MPSSAGVEEESALRTAQADGPSLLETFQVFFQASVCLSLCALSIRTSHLGAVYWAYLVLPTQLVYLFGTHYPI